MSTPENLHLYNRYVNVKTTLHRNANIASILSSIYVYANIAVYLLVTLLSIYLYLSNLTSILLA